MAAEDSKNRLTNASIHRVEGALHFSEDFTEVTVMSMYRNTGPFSRITAMCRVREDERNRLVCPTDGLRCIVPVSEALQM